MTYAQRLKKATKRAFQRYPQLGWAAAKDRARNYLNFFMGLYPSTPALIKQYDYIQRTDAPLPTDANSGT